MKNNRREALRKIALAPAQVRDIMMDTLDALV